MACLQADDGKHRADTGWSILPSGVCNLPPPVEPRPHLVDSFAGKAIDQASHAEELPSWDTTREIEECLWRGELTLWKRSHCLTTRHPPLLLLKPLSRMSLKRWRLQPGQRAWRFNCFMGWQMPSSGSATSSSIRSCFRHALLRCRRSIKPRPLSLF